MKILFLILLMSAAAAAQKFDFGKQLTEKDIYSKEKGYGFERTEKITCRPKFCTSEKPFFFLPKSRKAITK